MSGEDVTPVFKYRKSSVQGLMSGMLESSIKFLIRLYWLLIYLTEVSKLEYVVSTKASTSVT